MSTQINCFDAWEDLPCLGEAGCHCQSKVLYALGILHDQDCPVVDHVQVLLASSGSMNGTYQLLMSQNVCWMTAFVMLTGLLLDLPAIWPWWHVMLHITIHPMLLSLGVKWVCIYCVIPLLEASLCMAPYQTDHFFSLRLCFLRAFLEPCRGELWVFVCFVVVYGVSLINIVLYFLSICLSWQSSVSLWVDWCSVRAQLFLGWEC